MQTPPPNEITPLLLRWSQGDEVALSLLLPIVYQELHRLAQSYLRRERSDHTLQPTALINEAYLRLIEHDAPEWQSRNHFFGVAARLMRQILVEHARAHTAEKRGGGVAELSLDDAWFYSSEKAAELVALDDALNALAQFDERKVHVIELRYFGGMSLEETAAALNLSIATITHETRLARVWLHREMNRN
ncbi:MAG TPA: sigma-70 family RNA polymerase sigma factor [Blastocatellia bacterium]|nr:sigma-70 family RNA polymerase sigma factor [Blastocatellia bacterium]